MGGVTLLVTYQKPKGLNIRYVLDMYVICMKQRTTIQIERKTLKGLKGRKNNPRETYDQLLNRLILDKNEM